MTESSQVYLITGAASGIGAELARLTAEAGHRVILADINLDRAQQIAAGIKGRTEAVKLDICSEQQWDAVLDAAWATYGRLDVLINNAAIVHTGYVLDVPLSAHVQTIETNFLGPMKGMLAGLKRMKAQGSGHIVTVCSMTGLFGFPGIASYAAAKHALRGFHFGVALEERNGPIKFTIVHPSSTETPMLDKEAEDDSMALAFVGNSVTATYVAETILSCMADGVIEGFAPPERGEVVRELSIDPVKLFALIEQNSRIGAQKLQERRARKHI
jgi:NAD(P)-dependent dehydrogenase (short-subunit alcohol dehydrogenase family)